MDRTKMIFWDFDGTLGYRKNGMWGASMLEALKQYDPGTALTAPSFRNFLLTGFPWHHPEQAYLPVRSADEWWTPILHKFSAGFSHYGIPQADAEQLAMKTRSIFLDLQQWTLFEDTKETLQEMKERGWKQGILSNHVPELKEIVKSLGILDYFDCFINSALVGYEKPNAEIFKAASKQAGDPEQIWMVGDNPEADIRGAESVGWNAILIRNQDHMDVRFSCPTLTEVIEIVESHQGKPDCA
ncbi:HAD family hydrolase [Paenibacillus senegalensis]|uniref:HAD family hydrolase n=1 Tax=Paenibacillus senegalensis TaxID=1465766 RepID=UPI0002892A9E|nr:HAD-IA family hydrolase [Paenibacillus senegalensis]